MKTLEDVLEEVAPQPDPSFVAEMERRMQEGFPSERSKRRLPRIALPALRPRAWAGAAAAAVLALAVSVSLLADGSDRDGAVSGGSDQVLSAPTPEGGAASSDSSAERSAVPDAQTMIAPSPPPPTDPGVAPGARQRRVERSAQLTLAADPGEFDRLSRAIFRITDRHDGFVVRSSFTEGDDQTSGGSFELRIPVTRLEQSLTELSRIATVRTRTESGADVTASFVSVRDSLRTARAEQKRLLRRLERATTDRAAESIRAQLAVVSDRIQSLRAGLRGMRERTAFATVLVDLVDEDAGAAAGETDEAVDDAVGSLQDILNFLIRAAGILVPVAIVALLVWVGAAYGRRRARERALA